MFKKNKGENAPPSSQNTTASQSSIQVGTAENSSIAAVPSEGERLLAEAIVFLVDGGQDDVADLLLSSSCSFKLDRVGAYGESLLDRGQTVTVLRVHIKAPRRAFDVLGDTNSTEHAAVVQAFRAVWEGSHDSLAPEGRQDARGNALTPVELVMSYGLTDMATQSRLRHLVRSMTTKYREVEGIQVVQQGEPITLRPIKIFPTGPFDRDDKLCFVIMPFAAQFQDVYDRGIKPGIELAGLRCLRGDDIMKPGFILGQIWSSLMEASYVVADLTATDGKLNGNVLYELGMAHVVGHDAILLTQREADVPFDLRHLRHVPAYTPTEEGLRKLSVELCSFLKEMPCARVKS